MQILVNGANLSAFLRSIDTGGSVGEHERTSFASTAEEYAPGLVDVTLSAEGFFSGAARATDDIFFAALRGGASIWTWSDFGFASTQTEYSTTSPGDGLVEVSVTAKSNMGRDRIMTIAPLAVRTATGNGASFDNAVATTRGGVGYLQNLSTSTSLAVRIQHSVDNSAWVDLLTFATATAPGAQRVAVTGTVNRWIRATWTITGSFEFFVGFGRY